VSGNTDWGRPKDNNVSEGTAICGPSVDLDTGRERKGDEGLGPSSHPSRSASTGAEHSRAKIEGEGANEDQERLVRCVRSRHEIEGNEKAWSVVVAVS